MAAEQQLERSVLERKEREELRAIAQAMALETNTRSKKADIIDQILRAAGVDPGSGERPEASNGASGTTRSRTSPRRRGEVHDASVSDTQSGPDAPKGTKEPASGVHDTHDAPGSNSNGSVAATIGQGALSQPETDASDESASGAGSDRDPGDRISSSDTSADGTPQASESSPSMAQSQAPTGQGGYSNSRSAGTQNQHKTAQHPQHGQGSPNGDAGNRRSRRRRGRERGGPTPGGDRELQGGGQDQQYQGELVPVAGLLDLRDEGYGFLRAEGYLPSPRDAYVSISQARRFALRKGDRLEGACRPAASNEKFPALLRIDSVSGMSPDEARARPRFEDLTPLFPDSKLRLEMSGAGEVTARIIDLLSPIGKGQRGLIVSPPKVGKTTIVKQIAHSIEANNPEVHLMVLLVDERPEEVTDMRRSVKGEVVASTFDRPSEEHTAITELAIERAKRLVENGSDVVIILDGITRLARAYNLAQPASGRIMSGGVDSGALYPPKKFFGAARNIEEGGSLTILATALVETGSKMDEVIFEEFKGTGNMELRLDRRLAERRLYPSIDVNASSTRHEELLFDRSQLQQVWKLRRVLNALANEGSAAAGLELLMDKIRTTKSNDEFLAEIAKGPAT